MKQGKSTYAFVLEVKKAYDTGRRDGLWYKLWEMGINGKMWRVITHVGLYMLIIGAASFWKGKSSELFPINQGVA